MSALGHPHLDQRPEIEVKKPEAAYASFQEVGATFKPLGTPNTEREERIMSENVQKMRDDEEKRRRLAREIEVDQYIAHVRGLGIPLSMADEERIRANSRK